MLATIQFRIFRHSVF